LKIGSEAVGYSLSAFGQTAAKSKRSEFCALVVLAHAGRPGSSTLASVQNSMVLHRRTGTPGYDAKLKRLRRKRFGRGAPEVRLQNPLGAEDYEVVRREHAFRAPIGEPRITESGRV
jgi:hypothetical protein